VVLEAEIDACFDLENEISRGARVASKSRESPLAGCIERNVWNEKSRDSIAAKRCNRIVHGSNKINRVFGGYQLTDKIGKAAQSPPLFRDP